MLRSLPGSSRRLQTHLVLVFVGLFVLIQAVAFVATDYGRSRVARSHISQELDSGEIIFQRLLAQDREQLEGSAILLAKDFGFRESLARAIATNDVNTIVSVLGNHRDRIHASVMQLVSLDGHIVAESNVKGHRAMGEAFRFPRLLELADSADKATATVVMADRLAYQLVVVPVRAPDLVAWVAMGFLLDDKARDLRDAINLEVSFVDQSAPGTWRLLASSLRGTGREAVLDALREQEGLGESLAAKNNARLAVTLPDGQYESRMLALEDDGGASVVAVLHRSLDAALRPFAIMGQIFFAIALAGLALFIAGSVMVSRAIANPVHELAALAKRIEDGDYAATAKVDSVLEIEVLARSIDRMRKAVSEREERILRLAYHDALTGLANRPRLLDRLDQLIALAQRSQQPVSVLLLDLDRFKYVNDALGHQQGDVVLQEVAHRLTGLLRDSDTVGRLGGDEFAILLPAASSSDAQSAAARVAAALDRPMEIDGQNVDVGASIGIASYPEHGADAATLLREADVAMYAAKRSHAGMMVFSESHSSEQQKQLSLLSDVRKAIAHDEFVLYYQPKVEISSGRVVGVEGLVRWQDPRRGLIPPGEFIPFLEQSGHIRSLTWWALRAGVRQAARWGAKGLVVSINISARDLHHPDLPRYLQDLLQEHSVAAERLCLELTESAFVDDPGTAFATVERLHDLGVKLSIDDYGTGYSSLAYIQRLPMHELKIDRSFVGRMLHSRDNQTIVRSTIELGHNLGLMVTAEGIEDAEAVAVLARMGCDTGQGFHIARPLAVADFEAWWTRYHADRGFAFEPLKAQSALVS
ncbi:MAG TPA: EAL domain-containing protein [Burkholderiaceae bacterium]|nr:EAL domain-containing protein [Burkholderiaceae bacterium]